MSHQGSVASYFYTYLYECAVELQAFNNVTSDQSQCYLKRHSFAGVSINWVGGRSMSWVKSQEHHLEGSSEVTLAASGRRAGTNKRVSVNDSPLCRG